MNTMLPPVLILLLAVTVGASRAPAVPTVPTTEAKVLGLSLADSEATVTATLGPPQRIERVRDEMAEAPGATLHYAGIVVYLVGDEVYRVSCTASRCVTPARVRVGSSRKDVVAAYGPADDVTIDSGRVLRYNINGSDSWLDFRILDDHVVEIVMWFDYS